MRESSRQNRNKIIIGVFIVVVGGILLAVALGVLEKINEPDFWHCFFRDDPLRCGS